jgi:hypothetical protein
MSEEQAFGLEGVERKAGFVPAVVDMPTDNEPLGPDFDASQSDLAKGVQEIQQQKDQTQRERESRLVDAEIAITDVDGQRRPANESLSTDLDQRAALAAEIDAMRNGVTTEQLQAEQPVYNQPQQPEVSAQPSPHDRMAKALQENPEILAGLQETIQQEQAKTNYAYEHYAAGVAQSAAMAGAALLANYPELAGLTAEQIPTAISIVAKQNPSRAQSMVDHLKQTQRIVHDAAQVQQQHQQWHAQRYRAAFDQDAARHDMAYDQWSRNQGVSAEERAQITQEVMAEFRRQGWNDQQIAEAYHSNPAMRSFAGQVQMHQAAAYRLQQQRMANIQRTKKDRAAPVVQRPGSPVERASDADVYLQKLSGPPGSPLTPRQAAALVTARRNARR